MANTLADFLVKALNSTRYSQKQSLQLVALVCKLLGIDESYLWKQFGSVNDASYASLLVEFVDNLLRSHPGLKILVSRLGGPCTA